MINSRIVTLYLEKNGWAGAWVCLIYLGGLSGCGHDVPRTRLPNVLMISVDTLRADHVGAYGYGRATTPTIDALASSGVCFENAYAPSPWTRPSHASLFTGLYPHRHGAVSFETQIRRDVVPLAEILTRWGYETAAFISNTNLTPNDFGRGFRTFHHAAREGRGPTTTTPRAIEHLEKRRNDARPFFLFAHYNDPHAGYRAHPRYEEQFARSYEGPVTGEIDQLIEHCMGRLTLDREDTEHLIDLYDAAIRQVDDELDELLEYIHSSDLGDNTLIVLISDHGEEFLEHGDLQHGLKQFEESVRIPMIFSGPGIVVGARPTAPVSLIDVVPTLLDFLEEPVVGLDGLSLLPWLTGQDPGDHRIHTRPFFFEASNEKPTPETVLLRPGTKKALRHGRFKLHVDRATDEVQLFDLHLDPGETKDLRGAHPRIVTEMLDILESFLANERPGARIEIDAERYDELRDLGYAGDH